LEFVKSFAEIISGELHITEHATLLYSLSVMLGEGYAPRRKKVLRFLFMSFEKRKRRTFAG